MELWPKRYRVDENRERDDIMPEKNRFQKLRIVRAVSQEQQCRLGTLNNYNILAITNFELCSA